MEEYLFSPSMDQDSDVRMIIELIDSGYKNITDEENVIILIGDTGSGKSTLANYLNDIELVAKQIGRGGLDKKKIVIDTIGGTDMKIGHASISETTIPSKCVDKMNNLVYWDCPGFGDTNGVVQDIVNAFYIKRIFDHSIKLKLIIVIEEVSLKGKAKPFINIIDTLNKLFISVEDFKDGLGVIITKGEAEVNDIREHLSLILSEQLESLNLKQKQILRLLASTNSYIELFPKPQTLGIISAGDKHKIRSMVAMMKPVNKIRINIAITDKSRIHVRALVDEVQIRIITIIDDLCKKIIEYYLAMTDYDVLTISKCEVRLINYANRICNFFTELNNIALKPDEQQIDSLSAKLKILPGELGLIFDDSSHKQFVQCIGNFRFFEQIDTTVRHSIRTSEWFFRFDQCSTSIKGISNKLFETIRSTIITNAHIGIQDLCNIIQKEFLTFDMINADSSIELFAQCKANILAIDELVLDNFDIEKFYLATTRFAPQMSALIDEHRQIVAIMNGGIRIEYNCIVRNGIRPLHDLIQKYKNKMSNLVQNLSNDIEYHLENYIQTIISEDNCYSLLQLKSMLDQYSGLTREIINVDNIQTLVHMLRSYDITYDFYPLIKKLNKLATLNVRDMRNDPINLDKYIKQLIVIKDKIHTLYDRKRDNVSIELKNQVNDKIEIITLQMKDFYNSTDSNQKARLVDVCARLSIDLNQKVKLIDVRNCVSTEMLTYPFLVFRNNLESNNLTIGIENLHDIINIINKHQDDDDTVTSSIEIGWYEKIIDLMISIKNYNQLEITTERFNYYIRCLSRNIDQCIQQIETDENLKTIRMKLPMYWNLLDTIAREINQSSIDNIGYRIENVITSILGTNHKIDLANIKAIDELRWKNKFIKLTHNIIDKTSDEIAIKIVWYQNILDVYQSLVISDTKIFPSSISQANFSSFWNQYKSTTARQYVPYNPIMTQQLNDIIRFITNDRPQVRKHNSGKICFTGHFVKISDIEKYITDDIKMIEIICLNVMRFDKNVVSHGVNWIIIAPIWEIRSDITIILSGADAKAHPITKAFGGIKSGINGSDGLPGLPGMNSGDFHGIGNNFINLSKLTIKVDGGMGGNGQNGGNGADGALGDDANYYSKNGKLSDIISKTNNRWPKITPDKYTKLYAKGKINESLDKKSYNRIKTFKGSPGSAGGNGGKGGAAGISGNFGRVKIMQNNVTIWEYHGKKFNGIDGKPGNPGTGGKYGNDLDVYIWNRYHTQATKIINNNTYAKSGKIPATTNADNQLKPTASDNDLGDIIIQTKKDFASEISALTGKNNFYHKLQLPILNKFYELIESIAK